MIPRFVTLEKPIGQTPLAALTAWKAAHPEYAQVPATYAGRLDPMAEGTLLVLLGDECKRQEKYRGLDKEYVIEVLLDLGTDTGDVLGMPEASGTDTHPSRAQVRAILATETGTKTVPYPAFSSKPVGGAPLFVYALAGTLGSIRIPEHEEAFYRIELLSQETIEREQLEERIASLLARAPRAPEDSKALGADFRQDAIRTAWTELFAREPSRSYALLTLRVTCASGSYMRTLAERLGKGLGTRALALSIRRTKIGRYRQLLGTGLWTRVFR